MCFCLVFGNLEILFEFFSTCLFSFPETSLLTAILVSETFFGYLLPSAEENLTIGYEMRLNKYYKSNIFDHRATCLKWIFIDNKYNILISCFEDGEVYCFNEYGNIIYYQDISNELINNINLHFDNYNNDLFPSIILTCDRYILIINKRDIKNTLYKILNNINVNSDNCLWNPIKIILKPK